MTAQLLAFVLYLLLVLGIGLFFFIKDRSGGEKDYFLGGRSMGPWVTAMSAQASDMSGWLLMGFPGSILAFGMGKVWIGIGLALGTALNWIFVAKRLRSFSKAANDSITLPQYLKNRFAAKNPALQIICAIVFLVFFTVYVASSFVAGKTVLLTVIPQLEGKESLALAIFALIIIAYTFSGGFKAVCWTDFFQGIMMLIALLSIPIIILVAHDPDAANLTVTLTDGTVNRFDPNPFSSSWQDIISGLGWGLGYFGMPHILVRFMSIKKPSLIKKSATVAIIWVVLSLGAAIAIAILGRMLVGQELLDAGMQERIFIRLVPQKRVRQRGALGRSSGRHCRCRCGISDCVVARQGCSRHHEHGGKRVGRFRFRVRSGHHPVAVLEARDLQGRHCRCGRRRSGRRSLADLPVQLHGCV